ncbi:RNA polymerase sigma factor [Bythopirellula goksoeyrii]|uniref:ECF RNA polymerase sigma-E factor n=1 Tax=Bythopirellula goksoeyrii TaxID=1400387 RepID=A0A5B9QDB0_9BACT|nr:RNA polymerase sigma factor [Bythopirellula goksoeyrii]QEG35789.1 ECF RNA polymerase sigma-E factor [Bythopirellula goksoeyrii]
MKFATTRRTEPLSASKSDEGMLAWADMQEATAVADACQQGDPIAQRRLYDVTHQNVYRLVVRMVGIQDAADVTQQVFLQAFRKISQFSGKSQIGTWMYRVAVNEALQHLRKRKRRQFEPLEQEPMDRSVTSRENMDDKELLERALGQLDPELRSAFLLREVEGLSYREIADALEIPEGTVGSRLNRARQELKLHLAQLGWEP